MNSKTVYKKLLCYGLFPERLDDIFSSKAFGDWVIKNGKNYSSKTDFQLAIFKATRNDNAPRIFGIPNPAAHLNTCVLLGDNWTKINNMYKRVANWCDVSMIVPKDNNKNKRLISLGSYDRNKDRELLETTKQFGKKYFVHADIASFFPSIYTHSIPWVLVGKHLAKTKKNKADLWFNKIDQSFQNSQNKETKGVPIGPDSSGIIAELILSRVDKKLCVKYEYNRFIDDYYCFCETREKAEQFIKDLSSELEIYKLSLNTKKTKISSLPKALNESWVRKLRADIDWTKIGKNKKDAVISFLDLASELFIENPGESPIRYAVQVVRKKKYTDYETFRLVFQYYMNLCFLYPYIIDICHHFINIGIKKFSPRKKDILNEVEKFLNRFLVEHIPYRRTDAITWSFYNAIVFDLKIKNTNQIIKKVKCDCVSLLMVYLYAKINKLNIQEFNKYYKNIENSSVKFFGNGKKGDYSEMWLFVFEFSRLENKSLSISVLEEARGKDISFLSRNLLSKL